MSLDNGNSMIMPVAPAYGGGGYGGFGGFGGWDSSLWLILIVLFGLGGFGGGWGFGGFGGGMGFEFPWLLNGQNGINANTNAGFNQAATAGQLSAIQGSLDAAEVANCNRAMDAMQTAYTNQIASMNQNFANQQALDARLGSMEMAQQNCCCENRAAVADLKYTVATEACADRAAVSDALNSTLNAMNAGIQSIKDQMCNDKIDAKNEKIAELQTQVNMQNLAASQAAQTAQIVADNAAQTQYLVNRVAPYPIPAYTVPNPYGCGGYNGFGYGFNGYGY